MNIKQKKLLLQGLIVSSILSVSSISSISTSFAAADIKLDDVTKEILKPKVLTIWMPNDKAYEGVKKIAERFSKDNNGYEVRVEHPDIVEIKYMQAVTMQGGPDIFVWAHDRIGDFAVDELIDPIQIDPAIKSKFSNISLSAVNYNGNDYGYPISIEAIGLVCNKDIVPNPPTSFEGFKELQENIKQEQKPIYALTWDFKIPYYTYPLLSALGGYGFKKTDLGWDVNDIGMNNQGSVEGLEYLVRMINEGYFPEGVENGDSEKMFINKRAGCILAGPWSWGKFKDAGIDFSVNALPTLKGQVAHAYIGVLVSMINPYSYQKDIAKKFIENYWLTDEGLKDMNDDKPLGVVALNSYEHILESSTDDGEKLKQTRENAVNGHLMPSVKPVAGYWAALANAIRISLLGEKKPKDALDQAAERTRNYRPDKEN